MKLNLQWVTETIKENYKKWNYGDMVLLQAQTGTGKTYFIKNVLIPQMKLDETMLIVCNRKHLKRQIKIDLIRKLDIQQIQGLLERYELESIEDLKKLEVIDKINRVGNVEIMSYQQLGYFMNKGNYGGYKFDINKYSYIVCDEAHYFGCDSDFNNKTDIPFDEIFSTSMYTIKIFISATLENIITKVHSQYDKILGKKPYIVHEYTTGTDYSYVDVKYIKENVSNIIKLIKNDSTDDKWLIFISDSKMGKKIKEELGDIAEFVKAGTKGEQVDNIVKESKFTCKVLITTKVFDNGVNFDDEKLKNIIIFTWDRTTFIQMLGRKRIDIEDADKVNLFIPVRYKKSFTSLLKQYNTEYDFIDDYYADKMKFSEKYDRDYKDLPSYLFYKDNKGWEVNRLGLFSLYTKQEFAIKMAGMMKYDKFAFVKEQLGWMGKYHDFNAMDYIEEVESNEKVQTLEQYIDSLVGIKLYKDERKQLIDTINLTDSRGRQQKAISTLSQYVQDNHKRYVLEAKKSGNIRYWLIYKKVI